MPANLSDVCDERCNCVFSVQLYIMDVLAVF